MATIIKVQASLDSVRWTTRRIFPSVEQAVQFVADQSGMHPDAVWAMTRDGSFADDANREWRIIEVPCQEGER